MSEPEMPDDADPDLLAAEFVLGTLLPEEAARVAADPALAASIAAWQTRLAPLARTLDPVAPPPDLWARIEAATRPAEIIPIFRRLSVWRGLTAGRWPLPPAWR